MANEIDNGFSQLGIVLTRDIRDLKGGKSIQEFIFSIREHDFLIMLISKEYLTSVNCMNEVVELLRTRELKKRIIPLLVTKWSDIFSDNEIDYYFNYWRDELLKIEGKLRFEVNEKYLNTKRKIENVNSCLGEFINVITDLNVLSFEQVSKLNYVPLLEVINYFELPINERINSIISTENLEQKEILIDDFLKDFPDSHVAWFQRGIVSQLKGQYERAEYAYRKTVSIFPQDSIAFYNLGLLQIEHFNNPYLSKEYFEQSLALNSLNSSAHYNYATLLKVFFEDEPKAIEHYKIVLQINPDHFEANYNLGTLIGMSNPELAIACFSKAIQLNPNSAETHNNLGLLLESRQMFENARKQYLIAISLNNNLPQPHFNLSRILKEQFNDIEGSSKHKLIYDEMSGKL